MNKRILSFVLTLIMLVSLIPSAALTASAAELSTSERAITVLKQLEGYSTKCDAHTGYIGYGTLCSQKGSHGTHVINEAAADAALREVLKDLDKAVNSFASRNGLSLSQSKHDALVLFSFQNGTAWTTGTGDFQTAVKSGAKGAEFVNAICNWNSTYDDNSRRLIEANMYLNNTYNSTVPSSRYILVEYDPNGGKMSEANRRYYDAYANSVPDIVPTRHGYTFMGWYSESEVGGNTFSQQVTRLTSSIKLIAKWQAEDIKIEEVGNNVKYNKTVSDSVSLYEAAIEEDEETKEKKLVFKKTEDETKTAKGTLTINKEFIDQNNRRWGHVDSFWYKNSKDEIVSKDLPDNRWIKLGEATFSNGINGGSSVDYEMDVTVTVTNTYLRVRAEDSIYSKELRRAKQGDQLRIVNTSSNDGFLWGQLADAAGDGVCDGWVALMYTNFEEVRGQGKPVVSYNVIAKATVVKPVGGYVNVRNGAGTDNQIVGALAYKTTVDIYEMTYVNGIRWGRYSGGWFCLSYADVEGIDLDDYVNNSGVLAYTFSGKILDADEIYTEAGGSIKVDQDELMEEKKISYKIGNNSTVKVSNLTAVGTDTWGKISIGWVKVSDAEGAVGNVDLSIAKYYTVVDGVTVREEPSASAQRKDNLTKGVEFNVNESRQIIVVGDTIWGFADKVGEGEKTYSGWVNLASKYVSRGDAPAAGSNSNTPTGKMATIVGADNVNVRIHHDIYAKKLGTIPRGTTVAILGEEDGWYKLDYDVDNDSETDSWVSNKYVEVSKAPTGSTGSNGSNGSATVETGLGIVANTYGGVNVRTGAGTGYAQVGKLLPGTTVEILEVTTKGASKWGRVKEGWICMDYVTMVNNYEILGSLVGGSNGSDNGTVTGSEVAIYTGNIVGDVSQMNVYKSTSVTSDVVRVAMPGESITLHEVLTVTREEVKEVSDTKTEITKTTEYWARINDGYIMNPASYIELDALDEATYTVTESEFLNVRKGAGTSNESIFKLQKGDQVIVTKLEIVDGAVWGYVEGNATEVSGGVDENGDPVYEDSWNGEGWISLAYCTKGAVSIKTENNNSNNNNNNNNTNTNAPVIGAGSSTGGFTTNASGYRYTGKVINTGTLNVRATASQNASKTTTLSQGDALVIYETTTSEGMAWGRCDAGWVYLYYVDLTPVVNGAVDARVVYNENTIIYTDMNCSETAGTYAKMSVIDIYEVVGKMARTELGWVNTDNLL